MTEELAGVEPPQAGLELTLARKLALEGIVRARGLPAADAEVTIAGASGTRTANSGPDGAFSFAGLAEGRYALRAVRDGEAAYRDGVMVAAGDGGTGVITVELQPATTLGGKLRERGGRPIAGGEVTLAEADGAPLPRTVQSDNEGNFRFVAVLPGSYVVGAHAEGFYPAEPKAVRVGKTAATVPGIDIRLDPGATVEGRVVDEHAQPVAGADVEVSGEAPDGTPIAMTATSSGAASSDGRAGRAGGRARHLARAAALSAAGADRRGGAGAEAVSHRRQGRLSRDRAAGGAPRRRGDASGVRARGVGADARGGGRGAQGDRGAEPWRRGARARRRQSRRCGGGRRARRRGRGAGDDGCARRVEHRARGAGGDADGAGARLPAGDARGVAVGARPVRGDAATGRGQAGRRRRRRSRGAGVGGARGDRGRADAGALGDHRSRRALHGRWAGTRAVSRRGHARRLRAGDVRGGGADERRRAWRCHRAAASTAKCATRGSAACRRACGGGDGGRAKRIFCPCRRGASRRPRYRPGA